MREKLLRLLRWYGRRRIAWCLYVQDVQEQRLDDGLLPSDAERKARAEYIEARIFEDSGVPEVPLGPEQGWLVPSLTLPTGSRSEAGEGTEILSEALSGVYFGS